MTAAQLLCDIAVDDILCTCENFDRTMQCGTPRRDSRLVEAGDVFFCIRGRNFDGHRALTEAAARGAAFAVLEDMRYASMSPIPWICIRDTAAAFLPACLSHFGHPEHGMTFYAVTGTNGKTSVTYMLEAIFSANPDTAPCAVFGTVENRIAGKACPTDHTTPVPEILAEQLSLARNAGVRTVILEASSHALAQKRLSGLHFACGIFTNLTEDHLDYHKSMEDYFLCKRQLFFSSDIVLANADDPWGRRLLADPAFAGRSIAYTPSDPRSIPVTLPDADADFITANRMAAAQCALLAGISPDTITRALTGMPPIPGRMERIVSEPFSVFIDYAHTPDALSRAITGLKNHRTSDTDTGTDGRILVLFGCGGDREREKRPKMGAIAAYLADVIVITSDNSRSEDPMTIISDILAGIPACRRTKVKVIPDRKTAIESILALAAPGDTVLLAGKGHETYCVDRSGTHPFSEREIVSAYLKKANLI